MIRDIGRNPVFEFSDEVSVFRTLSFYPGRKSTLKDLWPSVVRSLNIVVVSTFYLTK